MILKSISKLVCQKFKAIPERAELNIIDVTRPLELVHIDF